MNNKFDKANPFKNTKPGFQLSPSYIYDIDLIMQAKNWKNPDTKSGSTLEQKNS